MFRHNAFHHRSPVSPQKEDMTSKSTQPLLAQNAIYQQTFPSTPLVRRLHCQIPRQKRHNMSNPNLTGASLETALDLFQVVSQVRKKIPTQAPNEFVREVVSLRVLR
jgi:hypothetical protein